MSDFSVIIPTYQRGGQLDTCLEGCSRLNYPRDRFEVIVVDDGSPEGPDGVVARWRDCFDITLVRQANAGPAAARNTGSRYARYAHLAFIDDDCVPDPGWLSCLGRAFQSAPDDLVGGSTINALPLNVFSSASQALVMYLTDYFDGRDGRTRLFTSNNMAVRADHFRKVGGFDAQFPRAAGEDREFCDRWISQQRGTTVAREAVVLHAHPLTLRTFWRQHFEYGRGAAQFRRARALRHGGPVRVEPIRFYLRLLKLPFAGGVTVEALEVASLVALSQVANTIGFLSSGRNGLKNRKAGVGARRETPPAPGPLHDVEQLTMVRHRASRRR